MIAKDTLIKVKNRDNGTVGYTIPDMNNLHRNFQPQEEKSITFEELQKLSWIPGGDYLIKNFLIVENEDALNELVADVQPEYFYTEDDIKTLLATGTLDQLRDCLDFAPSGVVDLVKQLAVSTECSDINKRQIILEKTGFNVTKAIEINHETSDEQKEETKVRRSAPIVKANETSTVRRTAAPARKIVSSK